MAVLAISALGGAAGFGIGGAFGYAGLGASIGWSIGSYIGNMLFAPKQVIEGPRLKDTSIPAGAEGAGIPRVWGTVRVRGEVIWTTNIIETRHEEEVKQGKGGGSSATQVTYTYSVSFAVGLCEGEIAGVRRIWADSKLIYSIADGADPSTFLANTSNGIIRMYRGTETQEQDPTIAAGVGASLTPAYRGLAYLVFENFQLADFGNHRPYIEAEVVRSGGIDVQRYDHAIGVAQDVVGIDRKRNKLLLVSKNINEGDATGYIYRWGGGSDTPVELADVKDAHGVNEIHTVGVDESTDELIVMAEGGTVYRYDAATGAYKGKSTISMTATASNGVVESAFVWEVSAFYDPSYKYWWTIAQGFNTGYSFLVRFRPERITASASTSSVTNEQVSTQGILRSNKAPILDEDERMWMVTTKFIVKCDPNLPETYDLPVDGVPEAAFIWKARGEIWVPRNSGHATDGWIVLNLGTLTFSDSADLGGNFTWTTSYTVGCENAEGRAWFWNRSLSVNNVYQYDANGVQTRSHPGAWSSATDVTAFHYIPGVVGLRAATDAASFFENVLEKSGYPLDDLVTEICEDCGVPTTDATDLASDTVRGFLLVRPCTGRAALEPLMGGFSFDGVESDGAAKFVKRGGASAATFTYEDLSAIEESDGAADVEPVTVTRAMETELPATIYLQFSNTDLDYNIGVARARRLVTESENVVTIEFPIVFTSEEANQVVDRLMRFSWLERERYQFSLPPKWRAIEPTDVITLPDGRRVRLTKTDYAVNGPIHCEGVSDDDGAPTSYADGNDAETGTGVTIGNGGVSTGVVLDSVLLRDIDASDDTGLYLGACGADDNWNGAVFYVSTDGGSTWTGLSVTDAQAKIGSIISGRMSAGVRAGHWDHGSVITVRLANPNQSLSTASSLDDFYNGENAFAVERSTGEWEIFQAYDVTANADNTFTLKNMLRGKKGSEYNIWEHLTGARIVALDQSTIVRGVLSANYVGQTVLVRAVTFRTQLLDATEITEEYDVSSAKPLSPAHVAGAKMANGDWRIHWVRRARSLSEWRNGTDVPLDESTEEYELEIYDPTLLTLKRTVTDVTTTFYTYTASMAMVDFANNPDFGAPNGIGVRVYQISERVGRGYAGEGVIVTPVTLSNSLRSTSTGKTAISNSGTTVSFSAVNYEYAPVGRAFAYGRWYWEVYINSIGNTQDTLIGVTNANSFPAVVTFSQVGSFYAFRANSTFLPTGTGFGVTQGDTVMVAWEWTANSGAFLYFGKNGIWQNSADPALGLLPQLTHPSSVAMRPIIFAGDQGTGWQGTARFGKDHAYPPPAGFAPILGELPTTMVRP